MFYELGVKKLVKSKGLLCYITPKFWMVNLEDENMRRFFDSNVYVNFIALCNPFESVVTENTIILLSNKAIKQSVIRLYSYDSKSFRFKEDLPIDVTYCESNLHFEWVIGIDKALMALLSKLGNNCKLKDISASKRGAEISKKEMRMCKEGIPALIGQDLKRYSIQWEQTYISKASKEFNRLVAFFSSADLIYLRRVNVCLEAAISQKPYGFNKNVYGIKIDETKGYSTKFILGLINSKLLTFYYKKKFSTKKEDVFPEIQAYLYEQLPIPPATDVQQKRIMSLVDDVIKAKLEGTNTVNMEYEIDRLVYVLYGLTDEEILLVEG